MATEVILPKVDMDMATGRIARWFAKEGDEVRKGEPLFEIETDKAAMEVDAPASGTLRDVSGADGADVPVGARVAMIYADGEAYRATSGEGGGAPAVPVGPDPDVEVDARLPAKALVEAIAASAPPSPVGGTATGEGAASKVRATPLARRLARERGIDLASLKGSGPLGRVQREDVEGAAARPVRPLETQTPATARSGEAAPSSGAGPLALVRLREGSGTPIVLVHGFGSETASWRPLLADYAGDGPVLGLDLPAHGLSADSEADGFDALVALAEATLERAGLASLHLVGHSLGGALAAALAAGGALDVRSLLLLAPAGFGPDIDTGFTEGFARAVDEAPVRRWLAHIVADPAAIPDGFVRATVRARADGRLAEVQTRLGARLFSNGTQHFDVGPLLGALAMPVKIVAGAEDRVVPARHFGGLPGTLALHLFARTGHMPHFERRAEVARLLRELTR